MAGTMSMSTAKILKNILRDQIMKRFNLLENIVLRKM